MKGRFENIQSLRRHYPDQVRGYDLSLFTLPRQGRHPFVFRRQKYSFFLFVKKKLQKLFIALSDMSFQHRLVGKQESMSSKALEFQPK